MHGHLLFYLLIYTKPRPGLPQGIVMLGRLTPLCLKASVTITWITANDF